MCCFLPWNTTGWLCSGTRQSPENLGYGSIAKQCSPAYSFNLIHPFDTYQGQNFTFCNCRQAGSWLCFLVSCHSQSATAVILLICSHAIEAMMFFLEIILYKWKNIFFLSGHKLDHKSNISNAINNLDLYKLMLNLFHSSQSGNMTTCTRLTSLISITQISMPHIKKSLRWGRSFY